ncbi:MAG: hypothetical protein ACRD1E_03730 [Terriglobales bacterium]
MNEEPKLAGSSVEMDETYYGGHRKGFRSGPAAGGNKKTVVNAVQRGGSVMAAVDMKGKLSCLARLRSIDPDVALAAAKIEAQITGRQF